MNEKSGISAQGAVGESSSTPEGDKGSKGKQRRGRGSKSRQAEKFREKKNIEWDKNFQASIEKKKIELGYSSEDLFGKRTISAVTTPQLQVPINTDTVSELCDLVAETLHTACKIPPSPNVPHDEDTIAYDADTLRWVSSVQIEAKMYHARAGTEFSPSTQAGVRDIAQDAPILLPEAILPLSVFIDQIGRFVLDTQIFVPSYNGVQDFGYIQLSNLTNRSRANFADLVIEAQPAGIETPLYSEGGRRYHAALANDEAAVPLIERGILTQDGLFTAEFLAAPMNFNFVGLLNFFIPAEPTPIPEFNTIVARFAELQGRVNKKLNNAFAVVDLSKGEGLPSQLVYTRDAGRNVDAWSPRRVPMDSLEIGTVLSLGWNNPLGKIEVAQIMTVMNTSGALQALANILTKRVR